MNPFYLSQVKERQALLEGEEARHCIKVLRFKRGDQVVGVDGKGNMYIASIRDLAKNEVHLDLVEKHEEWGEKNPRIILLASPLHKPDRFEWLVEKAVELGVNEIRPFIGKHTVKPSLRLDRLQRIMISALKQCQRSRLPEIHKPEKLSKVLDQVDANFGIFAQASEAATLHDHREIISKSDPIMLAIGPEGDFAPEEIELLREQGLEGVTLGTNRLRSETAAIHLLSLLKHYLAY